ncbi:MULTISPECIES: hypothetical protein [Aeromonas]|uniref:hypothetical protein n=1 Tax=Aeromonas TaxID=642 RepID=UPI002B054EB8|nr:hypothetical protein [Aeromonas jandaei]
MKLEPTLEEVLDDLYEKNVALLNGVTLRLDAQTQRYILPAVATAAIVMLTGYLTAATVGLAGTPQEELQHAFEAYAKVKDIPIEQVTFGAVVKAAISGDLNSLVIAAPAGVILASASAGVMLAARGALASADKLLERISGSYHDAKVERLANLYAILKEEFRSYRNMEETQHFPKNTHVPDPQGMLKHILLNREGSLRNYDEAIAKGDIMHKKLKM